MKTQAQGSVGVALEHEPTRSASERIVKISEGIYVLKPRKVNSSALPRGPFKGVCRETGSKFVYYATQVKRNGEWMDPVIDLHPEKLRERMLAREKAISQLPTEVMLAWNA